MANVCGSHQCVSCRTVRVFLTVLMLAGSPLYKRAGNVLGIALVSDTSGIGGRRHRIYQLNKFVHSACYQKPKEQFL